MAEKPTSGGLDTPLELRSRMLPNFGNDPDAFGRFAERFARYMGTANFLFYMTIFVVVWIAFNVVGLFGFQWDPYPFILLNLFFSTQASYAAPLILLAQNRQDDRDRVTIEQDRARDERNLADTEYLTREVAALRIVLREVATRDYVRAELRSLLSDLLEAQEELGTNNSNGSNGGEKAKDKVKDKRDKQRNPRTQQIPKIHPAHSSATQPESGLSTVGTSPRPHSGSDQPES
ncbi:putative membrane protein [Arthrobacter sp. AZCC_0090]|nr:putative membrane protein [Arthrobacter sp. AZCC_0090]